MAASRAQRQQHGEITAHRAEELYWKTRQPGGPDWDCAFSGGSALSATGIWVDRHGAEWAIKRLNLDDGHEAVSFLDKPGILGVFWLPARSYMH